MLLYFSISVFWGIALRLQQPLLIIKSRLRRPLFSRTRPWRPSKGTASNHNSFDQRRPSKVAAPNHDFYDQRIGLIWLIWLVFSRYFFSGMFCIRFNYWKIWLFICCCWRIQTHEWSWLLKDRKTLIFHLGINMNTCRNILVELGTGEF